MPTTIIKGYKLQGSDLRTLEDALTGLQKEVELKGHKFYASLLAHEIQELVDDVAFNIVPRPDVPLYDVAVKKLDERIGNAIGRNLPIRYNLGVQAVVFIYNGDTYIKMNINNESFAKTLKVPAQLMDFTLYDGQYEAKQNKERGEIWNEIMQIYSEGNNPMIKSLFPTGPIQLKWKQIESQFDNRAFRISTRVRHQLTNTLLNLLGMNQQIPPHKLLPYLDEAMSMLENDSIKADATQLETRAQQIVVNITEDFVKLDPKAAPPKTFEAQAADGKETEEKK